jgi:5-methyltetrahydrofolate--homocysteine methyltransferase
MTPAEKAKLKKELKPLKEGGARSKSGGSAISAVAKRFGITAREARDIATAVGSAATAIRKSPQEGMPVKKIVNDGVVDTRRSDVQSDNPIPTAPFYGSRVVKGIALNDYASMIDERALFLGQWGLKNQEYSKMVVEEGRPRLRSLLNDVQSNGWLNAAVTYGYFPCYSEGNDLVILHHEGPKQGQERTRFSFPRQSRDRRLCLADFFRHMNY